MAIYFATIGDHIVRFQTDALWIGMWLGFHFRAVASGKLRSPRLLDLQADLEVEIAKGDADLTGSGVQWGLGNRRVRIAAGDESALERAISAAYGEFVVRHEWGLLLQAEIARTGQVAVLRAGSSDMLALVRIVDGGARVYDTPFRGGAAAAAERLPLPLSAVHWLCRPGQADIGISAVSDAMTRLAHIAVAGERDGEAEARLARLCRKLADRVPMYEAATEIPPPVGRGQPSVRR